MFIFGKSTTSFRLKHSVLIDTRSFADKRDIKYANACTTTNASNDNFALSSIKLYGVLTILKRVVL